MISLRGRFLVSMFVLGTNCFWIATAANGAEHGEGRNFPPFIWPSEPPKDCPFEPSKDIVGIANMNDASKYEFYAGRDAQGKPIWTRDFAKIQPLIDWNNNCGCVTVTYDAPLKKYLMYVTDGWPTCAKMNSCILEANEITGPWRLVTYMKDFGEQGYFLNIPTKFISPDGRTAWLCYSGNFAKDWRGTVMQEKPPGSHYGLVLQQIRLLDEPTRRKYVR